MANQNNLFVVSNEIKRDYYSDFSNPAEVTDNSIQDAKIQNSITKILQIGRKGFPIRIFICLFGFKRLGVIFETERLFSEKNQFSKKGPFDFLILSDTKDFSSPKGSHLGFSALLD